MKRSFKLLIIALISIFTFCIGTGVVRAAACPIDSAGGRTIAIMDNLDPFCNIAVPVDDVHIAVSEADFYTIIVNFMSLGYSNVSGVVYATITDDFAITNINGNIGSFVTPIDLVITPGAGTYYNATLSTSAGVNLTFNFVGKDINVPVGTPINDAIALFININEPTVRIGCGTDYVIYYYAPDGAIVVHSENWDLHDAFERIYAESLAGVRVVTPNFQIHLDQDGTKIFLEGDLNEEQVLALLGNLAGIDAIVVVHGNDSFYVVLSSNNDPVVVYRTSNDETNPKTSDINMILIIITTIITVVISAVAIINAKKRYQ